MKSAKLPRHDESVEADSGGWRTRWLTVSCICPGLGLFRIVTGDSFPSILLRIARGGHEDVDYGDNTEESLRTRGTYGLVWAVG